MTTIRLLLSIVSTLNWHLHQLDINTAFLHGDLEEQVYMKRFPDLDVPNNNNNNIICRLIKSIYGLKYASRQWNKKLLL